MRDTREIQTEPVRGGKKTESEAGVELRRNQFQPAPVAELAGVVGGVKVQDTSVGSVYSTELNLRTLSQMRTGPGIAKGGM